MNKIKYIALICWFISFIIFSYNYIVLTGYWGTALLLSLVFYIGAIFLNKRFNKWFGVIAILYIGFGIHFIVYAYTVFFDNFRI